MHSKYLASKIGLTTPQLLCLNSIVVNKTTTQSRIGKEVNLNPSTIVGIIDRLELKGYITRKRDTHDRRIVWLMPTERGIETANLSPSPLQDTLLQGFRTQPLAVQQAIADSFEKVVAMIEADEIDAAPILESQLSINDSYQDDTQW